MKLLNFSVGGERRLGFSLDEASVADLGGAAAAVGSDIDLPVDLLELVCSGAAVQNDIAQIVSRAQQVSDRAGWSWTLSDVTPHFPFRPRKNIIRAGGNSGTMCGVKKPEPARRGPGMWSFIGGLRYYTKSPTSVLDPSAAISWPLDLTEQVFAEPQLAIVVGDEIHYATPDEAQRAIFGYAVSTDLSGFDLKIKHGQWDKAVSLDTFFPWGPFIVTSDEIDEPERLGIRLRLNDEVVIVGSTGDTILPIGEMLSQLSMGIRLEAGDVLLLGTPECVGFGAQPERWLRAGDRVESEIDGVGVIVNTVAPN